MIPKIQQEETICALATPNGVGAIAVIRVSGKDTFKFMDEIFAGKKLSNVESHTIHFGTIRDNGVVIDEVLVSVFKTPKSYTREDTVEISCHGSNFIIRSILKVLVQKGCRMAKPGEFTQRAFLNGQLDLVQAEAVADLIASDSASSHRIAMNQLRGGFSKKLGILREELINFASLIELELDFGEEDVEFANRDDLKALINKIQQQILPLVDSFDAGNVIKEGIPVAIIGPPNAGKSTLLNALLNEEKAIVTEIAGTTRDIIEDTIVIDGVKFRFIDTAGIRETQDLVESIGIERSKEAMKKAEILIMLYEDDASQQQLLESFSDILDEKKVVWVRNKIDLSSPLTPLLGGEGNTSTAFSDEKAVDETQMSSNFSLEKLEDKLPSLQRRGAGGEVQIFKSVSSQLLEKARKNRKTSTDAEDLLWQLLRNRQLNDLKFRRQFPIETSKKQQYILDFYCHEFLLGIEIDGGYHEDEVQKQYDISREREIRDEFKIKIIRFNNDDIFGGIENVLKKILDITTLPLTPLLGGEGDFSIDFSDEKSIETTSVSSNFSSEKLEDKLPSLQRRGAGGEVQISAKANIGIEILQSKITSLAKSTSQSDTTLTNLRHYEHLVRASQALDEVLSGLEVGITGDFLAQDIRLSLHHLGEITGSISSDDLLANIFGKFCIGK